MLLITTFILIQHVHSTRLSIRLYPLYNNSNTSDIYITSIMGGLGLAPIKNIKLTSALAEAGAGTGLSLAIILIK